MNNNQKKLLFVVPLSLLLCLMFLISACASQPTYPVGGGSTPTPTATAAQSGNYSIATASVSVKGVTKVVLTNAQGYTLYYFTPDTPAKVACTADCASTWPPLLYTGSGTPTSKGSLPGALAVQSNANGHQVLYQNHYLYTFSGDSAPGQANGEGIGGKWYVATPDLS